MQINEYDARRPNPIAERPATPPPRHIVRRVARLRREADLRSAEVGQAQRVANPYAPQAQADVSPRTPAVSPRPWRQAFVMARPVVQPSLSRAPSVEFTYHQGHPDARPHHLRLTAADFSRWLPAPDYGRAPAWRGESQPALETRTQDDGAVGVRHAEGHTWFRDDTSLAHDARARLHAHVASWRERVRYSFLRSEQFAAWTSEFARPHQPPAALQSRFSDDSLATSLSFRDRGRTSGELAAGARVSRGSSDLVGISRFSDNTSVVLEAADGTSVASASTWFHSLGSARRLTRETATFSSLASLARGEAAGTPPAATAVASGEPPADLEAASQSSSTSGGSAASSLFEGDAARLRAELGSHGRIDTGETSVLDQDVFSGPDESTPKIEQGASWPPATAIGIAL